MHFFQGGLKVKYLIAFFEGIMPTDIIFSNETLLGCNDDDIVISDHYCNEVMEISNLSASFSCFLRKLYIIIWSNALLSC